MSSSLLLGSVPHLGGTEFEFRNAVTWIKPLILLIPLCIYRNRPWLCFSSVRSYSIIFCHLICHFVASHLRVERSIATFWMPCVCGRGGGVEWGKSFPFYGDEHSPANGALSRRQESSLRSKNFNSHSFRSAFYAQWNWSGSKTWTGLKDVRIIRKNADKDEGKYHLSLRCYKITKRIQYGMKRKRITDGSI
jgi:hypothetical protein